MEEKQGSQELLDGFRVFKAIINQIMDAVLVIDPITGRFIFCNESVLKMMKCAARGDIIGKKPHEISPTFQPDGERSQEKAEKIIAEVIEKGEKSFDWLHICCDGSEIDVEVSLSKITYGNRIYLVTNWRDVTEKKRAERKYDFLFNELPLMIFLIDRNGIVKLVNDQGEIQLGYSVGELNERSVFLVFPEKNHEAVRNQVHECLNNPEKIHKWTIEKITKDGSLIWVEETARIIKNENGEREILIVCQDVTEQKKIEDNLEISEEKFRSLVENAPIGIHHINKDWKTLYVNPRFVEITGYTQKEIPDKRTWFDLVYKDEKYRKDVINKWIEDTNIATPKEVFSKIFTITDKSGQEKEVQFVIVILEDRIQLLFINDITEQRQGEKKLQQAQRLEGIGTLAGGIAHDFNNILSVIIGYCSLSESLIPQGSSKLKNNLATVKKSAEKASNLVNELMAFSRKKELKITRFKLEKLFKNQIFLSIGIGENVSLIINDWCDANKLEINGDFNQLEQVIMNMVINSKHAIEEKFGSNGGGEIFIEIKKEVDTGNSGKFVKISISDNGIGIKEENVSKIFNPFFTTKEEGKGTGLGLALAYGIITQHGGIIEVESEYGSRTTFSIFLPMNQEMIEPDGGICHYLSVDGYSGKAEKILLVEDNIDIRIMCVNLLRANNYIVFEALDYDEAKLIFEKEKIDILLSDIVLERGINGVSIADRFTQANPNLSCVLMSGYSDNIIKQTEIIKKGYLFFQKPFLPITLLEKIKEAIKS